MQVPSVLVSSVTQKFQDPTAWDWRNVKDPRRIQLKRAARNEFCDALKKTNNQSFQTAITRSVVVLQSDSRDITGYWNLRPLYHKISDWCIWWHKRPNADLLQLIWASRTWSQDTEMLSALEFGAWEWGELTCQTGRTSSCKRPRLTNGTGTITRVLRASYGIE